MSALSQFNAGEANGQNQFNASIKDARDKFDANMQFVLKLVDYQVDTSWVGPKIKEMKQIMDSPEIPEVNPHCENCAYIEKANILAK